MNVTPVEPDTEKVKPTIEMLLAKALWPEIDLATVRMLQVPIGTRWASFPMQDNFGQVVTKYIPMYPIILKLSLAYEPQTNTIAFCETEMVGNL